MILTPSFFLVEPTSGLDSVSAFVVVMVLKRIACSGSIVIMSIRQPSFRIVGFFNQVISLSRGNAVYTGPPAQFPAFFVGFGRPVPEKENQIEFDIDLVRQLKASQGGIKGLLDFHDSWNTTRSALSIEPSKNDSLMLKEAISASISRVKLVWGNANQGKQNSSESMLGFANLLWNQRSCLHYMHLEGQWRMLVSDKGVLLEFPNWMLYSNYLLNAEQLL